MFQEEGDRKNQMKYHELKNDPQMGAEVGLFNFDDIRQCLGEENKANLW